MQKSICSGVSSSVFANEVSSVWVQCKTIGFNLFALAASIDILMFFWLFARKKIRAYLPSVTNGSSNFCQCSESSIITGSNTLYTSFLPIRLRTISHPVLSRIERLAKRLIWYAICLATSRSAILDTPRLGA